MNERKVIERSPDAGTKGAPRLPGISGSSPLRPFELYEGKALIGATGG